VAGGRTLSAIDAAAEAILQAGMADPDEPVFVSTLRVSADAMAQRHADVVADADDGRILRSVLMKPESETYLAMLHSRLEKLAVTSAASG